MMDVDEPTEDQLAARWFERGADGQTRRDAYLADILRTRHVEPGSDLRGIDLSEENLAGVQFSQVDLSGANLTSANLSGANLSFAKLRGACLFQAVLDKTECLGADFTQTDCRESRGTSLGLGNATLTDSSWFSARLSHATFTNADLTRADFRTSTVEHCRMRDSNLVRADFTGASLPGSDLSGSDVTGARFDSVNLQDAAVEGLKGYVAATWIHADIRQTNFCGAYTLRRHIADENFLHELRTRDRKHAVLYWIWWVTSDCGRSMLRWTLWSGVILLLFAFLYTQVPLRTTHEIDNLTSLYYSVVTMTTLGYGDIVPETPLGKVLVMIQVILGYLALGGVLSIFATKMGRRAD